MSKITEWSNAIRENKWLVLIIIGLATGNIAQGVLPMMDSAKKSAKSIPPSTIKQRTIVKEVDYSKVKSICEAIAKKAVTDHEKRWHNL